MDTVEELHQRAAELRQVLEPPGWLGLRGMSPHARALPLLLAALGWSGPANRVCEALPHMADRLDRIDLVNTMVNLGFNVQDTDIRLAHLDHRLAPCLFVAEGKAKQEDTVLVLLSGPGGEVTALRAADDDSLNSARLGEMQGTLYRFSPLSREMLQNNRITTNPPPGAGDWFRHLTRRFDAIFAQSLCTSTIINVLALASSLFVMVVYDKVIGSHSPETLNFLLGGVLFAIVAETVLRHLRARGLVFFGVRVDAIVSTTIFERLMYLPPRLIESSSIPSQVARIKDFDSIRDFFSGGTGISVLELPFTLIFLATIAVIGGPLALVPLVLALAYTVLALIMLPRINASTEQGASASVKKQALLVETMKKLRAIKAHGLATVWLRRHHELSGQAAMTGFRSSFLSALIEAFAYGLSIMAGVTTLTCGIWLVWQNQITAGALIASMMLVWRVLTPLQAICNSLVRIRYIFRSISQVHKLIRTPPEGAVEVAAGPPPLKGAISFSGVGLRYTSERGAVFNGLNINIRPGELVAITGTTGAGKSSLLKLVNGLYAPQIGAILLDGIDIRQRNITELRKHIAYAPQVVELFHGSIEKNLRMAKPDASDTELLEAITWAGGLEMVNSLPERLNTFIGDYRSEQLSSAFTAQLNLARAYLRDAPIMLIDELPSTLINDVTGVLFREYLSTYKGRKTILFVTDRQDLVLLADRLVYLPGTGTVLAGEPRELLEALQK